MSGPFDGKFDLYRNEKATISASREKNNTKIDMYLRELASHGEYKSGQGKSKQESTQSLAGPLGIRETEKLSPITYNDVSSEKALDDQSKEPKYPDVLTEEQVFIQDYERRINNFVQKLPVDLKKIYHRKFIAAENQSRVGSSPLEGSVKAVGCQNALNTLRAMWFLEEAIEYRDKIKGFLENFKYDQSKEPKCPNILTAEQAVLQDKYRKVEELIKQFPSDLQQQYRRWRNDPDRDKKGEPQDQFYRLGEFLKSLRNQLPAETSELRQKADDLLEGFGRTGSPKSEEQGVKSNSVPVIMVDANFSASVDAEVSLLRGYREETASSKKFWLYPGEKKQNKDLIEIEEYKNKLADIELKAASEKRKCWNAYIFTRKSYNRIYKILIDNMVKVMFKEKEEEIFAKLTDFKSIEVYIEHTVDSMKNILSKISEGPGFNIFIGQLKCMLEKEIWRRHKTDWMIWNLQKKESIESEKENCRDQIKTINDLTDTNVAELWRLPETSAISKVIVEEDCRREMFDDRFVEFSRSPFRGYRGEEIGQMLVELEKKRNEAIKTYINIDKENTDYTDYNANINKYIGESARKTVVRFYNTFVYLHEKKGQVSKKFIDEYEFIVKQEQTKRKDIIQEYSKSKDSKIKGRRKSIQRGLSIITDISINSISSSLSPQKLHFENNGLKE